MPKRAAKPVDSTDVMLFDTYSLVFRAFHALPAMTTSQGVPTSALYGFASVVLKLLREWRPRRLAFAVDAPQRTFRRERYEDYKAQRPVAHPELREQLGLLPELLEAFEVPIFAVPGFEADDVLCTLSKRLVAEERVLVVSGDRDLLQLVNDRVRVYFVGARGKDATLFDTAKVEERFGVPPAQLPSYSALVGDNSDNLVGAPGVGPSTAAKLVREHGTVQNLLASLERVSAPKLRETLTECRERLALNEELATLRCDVPLPGTALGEPPPPLASLAGPLTEAARARLQELFERFEFKSLVPRLLALDLGERAA